ncbi:MAG: polyprenyl synthetase family protein [Candidatus Competibacteraceae bacterium]|nr:polyprenyl synthetase family protein [Candidatus Competibacteraceae bacterium]
MGFVETYSRFKNLVDDELGRLQFSHQSNSEIYQPLDYMLGIGGKRLRPVMTLAACEAFGGNISDALLPALGFEVFHNFTLIHDDIMDNAPLRRGKPTVHHKWNTNMGILSGDMMLIKAYELIGAARPEHLPALLHVFNQIATAVCEGQQLDMEFEKAIQISMDDYLRMVKFKTGVLLGGALQAGAIMGGASNEDALRMFRFGCKIGTAFQIMDDWLDTFGDPEKTGKRAGGDILERKKTFLMVKANEISDKNQRFALQEIYVNGHSNDEIISMTLSLFDTLNISQITQAEIQQQYSQAIEELKFLPVSSAMHLFFNQFAEYLIRRES